MSAPRSFGPRAALGLVALGTVSFLVLLYAIGAGLTGGGNDGGAHALSKGLTGYAGLAKLLEQTGTRVVRSRDPARLAEPGLLVLTPPGEADGGELVRIVEARRRIGPTLIVLPKWIAIPARSNLAKAGWVQLIGTDPPGWTGLLANGLAAKTGEADVAHFNPGPGSAKLAAPKQVQYFTIGENAAFPLIRDSSGHALVAYLNDDGDYPLLDRLAGWEPPDKPDRELHPVVIVAEPDLLDNHGLADEPTAINAHDLIRLARGTDKNAVIFDVTLNGLGRARNLLTLAFTPPFLAATLALLLAALAVAWRGFIRFGPPRIPARTIAYGKIALVENSAGLIRRAGRIRLLGAPYAALVTQRTGRALGLPINSDVTAIDAAMRRRGIDDAPFSVEAAALAAARKPADLLRSAAALNAIEKALAR